MALVLIAGAELYNSLQAERDQAVKRSERGFNSEQLCALQRRQAGRGVLGAEIVQSAYGYSVRYDSGLQDWGLLRAARGASDPSLSAAEEFCREWVAGDPARRYAWRRE